MKKLVALLLLLVLALGLSGCGSTTPNGEYARFYDDKVVEIVIYNGKAYKELSKTREVLDTGKFKMDGEAIIITLDGESSEEASSYNDWYYQSFR